MKLNIWLILPLVHLTLGANRVAIDKKSCSGDLYSKVRTYVESALKRGLLVQNALMTDDQRIKDQLKVLFGSDDRATIGEVSQVAQSLAGYKLVDIDDVWSESWKGDRDDRDVQIHCNGDFVVKNPGHLEPNINWQNSAQDIPIRDGRGEITLNKDTDVQAMTLPAEPWKPGELWPAKSPELIALQPKYIQRVAKKGVFFNNDLIQKALHPSLMRRLNNKLRSIIQVDVCATAELTMFHEFTHLFHVGNTIDTEQKQSYGWENCVRLKQMRNAENHAYFALVVDLIVNHKIDVFTNGTLNPFT